MELKCENCGRTFYRTIYKGNSHFCCIKCYSESRRMRGGTLTPEQRRYIEKYYQTRTYKSISENIGASIGRINRYIHGVLKSGVYNERLTKEQKDAIDKMRRGGGYTAREISEELNVGYYQVANHAARNKVERRHRKYTDEELRYIRENYHSRPCNAGQIASRLGVSISVVKRLAKELGVMQKNKRRKNNGRGREEIQGV